MKLLDYARQELEVELAEAEQRRLADIKANGERLLLELEYMLVGDLCKEFASRVVVDTSGLRMPGQRHEVAVATLDGLRFALLNNEYGGRDLNMLFECPECQQIVTVHLARRVSAVAEAMEQWEANRCGHECGKEQTEKPEARVCPLIPPADNVDGDCWRDGCAWWSDGACAVVRLGKACEEYSFASAE